MITIIRKELADYFTSVRCTVLFVIVLLVGAAGLYAASQGIRGADLPEGFVFLGLFTTQGGGIPSYIVLIAWIVPIIGIALSFDAINGERSGGTLSRILSQPIYRDNVINGKFLAGIITLSIMVAAAMLIVFGYGMQHIGVVPTSEEALRLFIYFIFTVIYGAFWLGLAMLFSVVIYRVGTSLIPSLVLWLFFSFFYTQFIIPAVVKTPETLLALLRISPDTLFTEATLVLLHPSFRGLGMLTSAETALMLPNPLSFNQSMLLIWPQFTTLIALSSILFAISYVIFMRQEIRST
jgi:ABC-2 type transport system permease protein